MHLVAYDGAVLEIQVIIFFIYYLYSKVMSKVISRVILITTVSHKAWHALVQSE